MLLVLLVLAPTRALSTDNPGPIPPTDPLDDQGPECPDRQGAGDPINPFSGQWFYRKTDLVVPGVFPIELVRQYDGAATYQSSLGYGWAFTYDLRLFEFPDDKIVVRSGCGVRHTYAPVYDGMNPDPVGWTTTLSRSWNHELSADPSVPGGYILRNPGGERYYFDPEGRLAEIRNEYGNTLAFSYSNQKEALTGTSPYAVDPSVPQVVAYQHQLLEIAEVIAGTATGRKVTFSYDNDTGLLEWAKSHDGRQVTYEHEEVDVEGVFFSTGNLLSVTDPVGIVQSFTYANPEDPKLAHRVHTFRDGKGMEAHLNYYNPDTGKITQQAFGRQKIRIYYDPSAAQLNDPNDFTTPGRQCGVDVDCRLVERDVVDPLGSNLRTAKTLYKYNLSGFLVETVDALRNQTVHSYQGSLPAMTELYHYNTLLDPPARVIEKRTTYQYDTEGNLEVQEREVDPASATPETISETWTYVEGRVSTQTTVSSAEPTKAFRTVHTFKRAGKAPGDTGYDPDDPITQRQVTRRHFDGAADPDETTTFNYNANGQLSVLMLPDGHEIVRTYYTALDDTTVIRNGLIKEVQHREGGTLGPELKVTYDYNEQGLVASETDARNYAHVFTWDDAGRRTVVENPLGERTIVRFRGPDGVSPGHLLYESEVGQTDADGDGRITRQVYDQRGHVRKVLRKNDSGVFVTFSTIDVDSDGNQVTITDGEGIAVTSEYDLLGRKTAEVDADSNRTEFSYDATGDRVLEIDAEQNDRVFVFDGLDRLGESKEPDLDPQANTVFSYDAAGNVATITDAENHTTAYDHDGLSRLRKVTRPLLDGGGNPVTVLHYDYDLQGRLQVWTNGRGNRLVFEYEPWGPVNAIEEFGDANPSSLIETITYGHDEVGNVLAVDRERSQPTPTTEPLYRSLTQDYDGLNRRRRVEVRYLPGSTKVLSYDFDRFGNRQGVTLSDGSETLAHGFGYNALGQLEDVSFPGGQDFHFDYRGNDDLDIVAHPSGLATSYVYDTNGELSSVSISGASETVMGLDYLSRDGLDRTTSLQETTNVGVYTWGFSYDPSGRVDDATYPAGRGLPSGEDFAYDLVGNREDPVDPAIWDYDANDRVLASPNRSYGFDADGNTTTIDDSGTLASLTYDARNQLESFVRAGTTSSYEYDQHGRRIRKTVAGQTTWFLWEGDYLLAEYDGTGNRTARYAYAEGFAPIQFASGVAASEAIYDVHTDDLGTPRVLTDSSGVVVWRAAYEAFGESETDEDPDNNNVDVAFPVRFPGQYVDEENALYYNRFRYLDPVTGRYLESDAMNRKRGRNSYAYVSAQPTVWVDPYGGTSAVDFALGRPSGGLAGTIECDGSGNLVLVINDNNKCTRECTVLHEEQHRADWIGRYGKDLCRNRAPGDLPMEGDDYDRFLARSECSAHRKSFKCFLTKQREDCCMKDGALEQSIKDALRLIRTNC